MKKLFALTALPLLLLSLTSCEVHWFNQSYDVPWYVIAVPCVLFVLAVFLIVGFVLAKRQYRCSQCGKTFHPKWYASALSIHLGARRVFRCPHCRHKGFCDLTHDE